MKKFKIKVNKPRISVKIVTLNKGKDNADNVDKNT